MPGVGPLDRQVTIQKPGTARNDGGGAIPGWTTYDVRMAEEIDRAGRELDQAGVDHAQADKVWRLRYDPGILPKFRLVDRDGGTHKIVHIGKRGRRQWTLLFTKSLQSD